MGNRIKRRLPRILVLLAVGFVAAVGAGGSASQTVPPDATFDLCATTGMLSVPGGAPDVPIWGFVIKGAAADCSDVAGTATLPGPPLDVNEGDVVELNITNGLPPDPDPLDPSIDHVISIEIPGIEFDAGLTDADVGATVTRTFTAGAPGTYLYESVGDAERQTAMGLYGSLIVRSTTAGQAYDDPASAYDGEATLVLSAVDPAFNADPDNFDMRNYLATYWLINGKAYPETDVIPAPAGQRRLLLRYVNAGFDNTTMMLLGTHERVIARDAYPLGNPFDADAETIPAGATEDAIATIPAASSGLPNGLPLYNRQLHLTNGAPGASPGGMLTFIRP